MIQTDLRIAASSKRSGAAFEYRYHVRYDDGDYRWESVDGATTRLKIVDRARK